MLQPKTYIQYNYSRIRNVLIFVFFFWFLKSVWGRTGHQNRWKWHFCCFVLFFLMIHGSFRRLLQFIAASFGVWGYRNRFLRSIMNVVQHLLNHSSQKKNIKPPLKFPLSQLSKVQKSFIDIQLNPEVGLACHITGHTTGGHGQVNFRKIKLIN